MNKLLSKTLLTVLFQNHVLQLLKHTSKNPQGMSRCYYNQKLVFDYNTQL